MTAVEPEPSTRALAHVKGLVSGPPLNPGLDVTVHFHPDRLVGEVPLLQHLVRDGVYRSQFETGTSNGGLTAYPGRDRWRWEHRMFAAHLSAATGQDTRPLQQVRRTSWSGSAAHCAKASTHRDQPPPRHSQACTGRQIEDRIGPGHGNGFARVVLAQPVRRRCRRSPTSPTGRRVL